MICPPLTRALGAAPHVTSYARAGPQCDADRHAELGTVRVPIAHAVAGTIRHGRVQLAAAVRIAEPEPDCCSDARAGPAADHGAAVMGAHPLHSCACSFVDAAWMRACVAQCACVRRAFASVRACVSGWMEVVCADGIGIRRPMACLF